MPRAAGVPAMTSRVLTRLAPQRNIEVARAALDTL
jgi:hypothetical protein